LFPVGLQADSGNILSILAEDSGMNTNTFMKFFDRYITKNKASESDYFPSKYSFRDKGFLCGSINEQGIMRVEFYSTTKY